MTAFLALAVLVLAACYIYVLSRRVDVGLLSLLFVQAYYFTLGLNAGMIGSVHLDPLDLVSFGLLIAGAVRTVRSLRYPNATSLLSMGYVVLLSISVGRGLYGNGVLTTLNESRGFVAPLVGMLYFLTAPTDEKSMRRYTQMYLVFGGVLCVVAALAAMGAPVGMSERAHLTAAVVNGRYLDCAAAAAIAVCGFLAIALLQYRRGGMIREIIPVLFLLSAIYLRHRTVWMMILAAAAALPFLDARLFRRLLPAGLVAVAVLLGIVAFGATINGLPDIRDFQDSATNEGTWTWRVEGWEQLLGEEDRNAVTEAIGESMGSGYLRVDLQYHEMNSAPPHSEYVQEYTRVGVVGSVLLVLFLIRPLVGMWRLTKVDPTAVYPSSSVWAVVVLMMLVYGIAYSIEMHAFALVGIANAALVGQKRTEESIASPESGAWEIASLASPGD